MFYLELSANHLSLIYLPKIAFTYNQPLTTSKNCQDPKQLQKLQLELLSLVSLLDPQLLPTITIPNRLTPSTMISPNSPLKFTISKHKRNCFDHAVQYQPLHITLQLISSTLLTKLIYLIYISGIRHLPPKLNSPINHSYHTLLHCHQIPSHNFT
jgi:hypothetical protein